MERLFFAVAGALLLAILAIIATAGYFQFRGVARNADRDALDAGQAVQGELLRLRAEALEQVTSAIAANAALVAYMNRALAADGSADVHSITDQLDARRDVLGLDILAILLPSGHLVAGTGKNMPQIHEFGRDDRFIQASRTLGTTAGMWSANEHTWQVAFSPMVQGGNEVAMLLAGRRHDARVAREIAATSRADYALVVRSESGPVLAASSLDAGMADTLAKVLRAHPEWMAEAVHAAAGAQPPLALGAFEPALRVHALADAGVSWLTIAPVARVDARARRDGPAAVLLGRRVAGACRCAVVDLAVLGQSLAGAGAGRRTLGSRRLLAGIRTTRRPSGAAYRKRIESRTGATRPLPPGAGSAATAQHRSHMTRAEARSLNTRQGRSP
jgi:hypothetical protein